MQRSRTAANPFCAVIALHDPEGLDAFADEIRKALPGAVTLQEVEAHINAPAFAQKALEIFDAWVAEGIIPEGRP